MQHIICTVTNDLAQDQRMHRIATALTQAGWRVTLVGRLLPTSKPLSAFAFATVRLPCFFTKGKFFYIEYTIRLLFFLYRQDFDIINSIDADTLLPAVLMRRWRKKIHVHDAHEYYTETPELQHRKVVKWIWERVVAWGYPQTAARYTVCTSLKTVFQERYALPFAVIRNVPFYKPNPPHLSPASPPYILLYQGVLNTGRGLEAMIDAMQHLPQGYRLWIVGKGDIETALRQQVRLLALEGRVEFLGFQTGAALQALTEQCTVGLNLLEANSLNYYYSLANKTFDYVHALKPALAMDFPEYRQLNQTYEVMHLVANLEVQTLVAAVLALTTDAAYYGRLQANCRLAKWLWQWEREAETLNAIYQPFRQPQ